MNNNPMLKEAKAFIRGHERILFSCCGHEDGPFTIFSAGIHGNEPSGVLALRNVINQIVNKDLKINGSLLAFMGNRTALNNGNRFSVTDLNRLWSDQNLDKLKNGGFSNHELNPDILEMIKINKLLNDFENTASGKEHYFIDLHTTSAPSIPFAVVDRQEECLNLALQFPLPVIINFNDYIQATMLNYFERKNFNGVVFEAGQHTDEMSVKKHEAIIWMALVETKALNLEDVPNYNANFELLNGLNDDPHKQFEIIHHLKLKETDSFEMKAGFVNFQKVQKGDLLATLNNDKIYAPQSSRIFMPLYQSKGEDGFFLVRRVN